MLGEESASSKSPTAFFYCSRSTAEPERGNPTEILAALIRQLASSGSDMPIKSPVAKEYEQRKIRADNDCSTIKKLSLDECTRLILELTQDNPATIIIDALDECEEVTWHELLEALDNIIANSAELVRVLVSSRDDVGIVSIPPLVMFLHILSMHVPGSNFATQDGFGSTIQHGLELDFETKGSSGDIKCDSTIPRLRSFPEEVQRDDKCKRQVYVESCAC